MADPTTRELIQRLADALDAAAEDIEDWASYAAGYFQEKHNLQGDIPRIRAQAAEARAYLATPEPVADLPPKVGHILRLAEVIREVDGSHSLGATALAEAILSHPGSRWQPATPEPAARPMEIEREEEIMSAMPRSTHEKFAEASRMCALQAGGAPAIWRVGLNAASCDHARAVLARNGHQPPQPISPSDPPGPCPTSGS